MFTGQWFDEEIHQYYLRARMYDPALMLFTSRDPVKGEYNEPLTLHKYLYCWNDSINYIDPSGNVGTLGDTLSASANYANMASNAYDIGNRFLDIATQVASGASLQSLLLTTVIDVGIDMVGGKGFDFLAGTGTKLLNKMGTYNGLRRLTKGSGLERHHLIEKRFSGQMGQKGGDMMSIILSKEEHAAFTKAWRKKIPYGNSGSRSWDEITTAAREIYADHPEILEILGL